ncbi:MAG: single-stranded DNA-binding protein [Bacillota bacterium]|nr:single-stranded DNA-binding protein [Bacillota bacterium]
MVNSVVLVGRLTRDPELRRTQSNMSVASFTLACDETRRGPNGEKTTIFIGVSVFGNSADSVAKFTRKGSLVGVVGRLTQRKYTNRNGVEVTATEIVANQVEFLEPKGNGPTNDAGYTPDAPSPRMSNQASEASSNVDSIDIVDDDLPF